VPFHIDSKNFYSYYGVRIVSFNGFSTNNDELRKGLMTHMSLEQLENDIEQIIDSKKGNQQAQYQDLKLTGGGGCEVSPSTSLQGIPKRSLRARMRSHSSFDTSALNDVFNTSIL